MNIEALARAAGFVRPGDSDGHTCSVPVERELRPLPPVDMLPIRDPLLVWPHVLFFATQR